MTSMSIGSTRAKRRPTTHRRAAGQEPRAMKMKGIGRRVSGTPAFVELSRESCWPSGPKCAIVVSSGDDEPTAYRALIAVLDRAW